MLFIYFFALTKFKFQRKKLSEFHLNQSDNPCHALTTYYLD